MRPGCKQKRTEPLTCCSRRILKVYGMLTGKPWSGIPGHFLRMKNSPGSSLLINFMAMICLSTSQKRLQEQMNSCHAFSASRLKLRFYFFLRNTSDRCTFPVGQLDSHCQKHGCLVLTKRAFLRDDIIDVFMGFYANI